MNDVRQIPINIPTKEQIKEYALKTIAAGQVIPGYGHAVLRKTDPRFSVQLDFANRNIPNAELIELVRNVYEVVPEILGSLGKVKNPWPNVDAISGSLLTSYGITEFPAYTMLFGVSRSLGVLSSLIWDRIYGMSIERPNSQTLEWFMEKVNYTKET